MEAMVDAVLGGRVEMRNDIATGPCADILAQLAKVATPSAADLAQALSVPVTLSQLASAVRFDDANYTRNVLARTNDVELRLLCWKPGQHSALHSHGPAACALRVISGTASEVRIGHRDRRLTAGDVVASDGDEMVHQMGNDGAEPLVTLHAYSPPLPVNQPSSLEGRRIVIVGGGFSGIATAYHLLRDGGADLRISIVDPGPWIGRGTAYGGQNDLFRLNVPASRMGVDPADASDFFEWARLREPSVTRGDLLPRSLYGKYIEARFSDALRASPGKIRIVRAAATGLDAAGVHLADGRVLPAEAVVIATGNEAPARPPWMSAVDGDPRVIVNPWDENALKRIPSAARVLVVGTGLTAVDVLLQLRAQKHGGKVVALSRHGLLPRPHLSEVVWAGPRLGVDAASAPNAVAALLAWVRNTVRRGAAAGVPWQAVFDELRDVLPSVWSTLPDSERQRFMRHVRPYWEVLRHRAPSDSLATLQAWSDTGGLRIAAGKVVRCDGGEEAGVRVAWYSREDGVRKEDAFDVVVTCTGPSSNLASSPNPFLRALLDGRHGEADPLGLGLRTDSVGRLLATSHNTARPPCFVVGALRKPGSWESTAAPDLAVQAATVARVLSASA